MYTFKSSGHRDLDRSVHCFDRCSACLGKVFIWFGAGTVDNELNKDPEYQPVTGRDPNLEPHRPAPPSHIQEDLTNEFWY